MNRSFAPSAFALVHRSLRIDSRSVSTYIVRSLCVAVGLLGVIGAHADPFGAPGLTILWWISLLNLFLVTLGAGSYYSSVITEEKEDMTLGLLRMTGLSPINILLGKSFVRLVWAIFLLAVQIPLVVLAISFGGASIEQVLGIFGVLGAMILFVSGVGLLASVIAKRNRGATMWVAAALLFLWLVPGITNAILTGLTMNGTLTEGSFWLTAVQPVASWLTEANPYLEVFRILRFDFQGGPTPLVVQFLLIGTLVQYFLAWLIFRKSRSFDQGATPGRSLSLESLVRKRASRQVWGLPHAWKDFFFVVGGKSAMLVKTVIYLALCSLLFWLVGEGGVADPWEALGGFAQGFGMLFFILELAILAGKIFQVEVKWQTLSGLVMLPTSTTGWILEKCLGAALTLTPVVLLFCVGVVLNPEAFSDGLGEALEEPMFYAFCLGVSSFVLLTANLSLYLRWGAFAAAGAIAVFSMVIYGMIRGLLSIGSGPSDEVWDLLTITALAGVSIAMLVAIPRRLKALASRG